MEEEAVVDADGYLYINLSDWVLMPHNGGEVVWYGIRTISSHSRFTKLSFLTRRQYHEYVDFWRFVQSRNEHVQLPPLPFPDDFAPEVDSPDTNDRNFITFRTYFSHFVRIPHVFNDPSLPLFSQTIMKMPEIRMEIERQENAAANNSNGRAAADNGNGGAAAADNGNNEEVPENDGNQSDEELAARGNRRGIEADEPIFHMDDI